MDTKTLKFNNITLTFLQIEGVWSIPAKLLGMALGYANDGQKLSDLITNSWSNRWKPSDFKVLRGEELEKVRKATPQYGVPSTASQYLVLSMSGVMLVLLKSRTKSADAFRRFLSENGGDLIKNITVPSRARRTITKKPAQMNLALEEKSSNIQTDLFKTLHEMKKLGLLSKAELKAMFSKVAEIQLARFTKENKVTHFLNPDGTVSATALPALTSTALAVPEGNFNLATKEHKYHPAFKDWLTAEDIGKPFGLKADLVKKYIKTYCANSNYDLPNNEAKKFVEQNNGTFPALDEHGYIVYTALKEKIGGIAIFSKMTGNSLFWRNYWSPNAVEAIKALIIRERKIVSGAPVSSAEPLQVFDPTKNFGKDAKVVEAPSNGAQAPIGVGG